MAKDTSRAKDAESESADITGTFRVIPSNVAFPPGLRIKVIDASVLTEAGKRALDGDVLVVDKVEKPSE